MMDGKTGYIEYLRSVRSQEQSLAVVLQLMNHISADIIEGVPGIRVKSRVTGQLIFPFYPTLNGGGWHVFHFGFISELVRGYIRKPPFKKSLRGYDPNPVLFRHGHQLRNHRAVRQIGEIITKKSIFIRRYISRFWNQTFQITIDVVDRCIFTLQSMPDTDVGGYMTGVRDSHFFRCLDNFVVHLHFNARMKF